MRKAPYGVLSYSLADLGIHEFIMIALYTNEV